MSVEIENLSQSDRVHLKAAEGWLELGNWHEANEELEQISFEMRVHPAVLLTRCQIYNAAKRLENVIVVAGTLIEQLPKLEEPWILRSSALDELGRTQDAYELLFPATKILPENWEIRYDLACYGSQLGRLKESMKWLEQAIDLAGAKDIRMMALNDEDLEPLWMQISEI